MSACIFKANMAQGTTLTSGPDVPQGRQTFTFQGIVPPEETTNQNRRIVMRVQVRRVDGGVFAGWDYVAELAWCVCSNPPSQPSIQWTGHASAVRLEFDTGTPISSIEWNLSSVPA